MENEALEDDSQCWPNREWKMEQTENGVLQATKELHRSVQILQAIYMSKFMLYKIRHLSKPNITVLKRLAGNNKKTTGYTYFIIVLLLMHNTRCCKLI
jgi:hypothetical protein